MKFHKLGGRDEAGYRVALYGGGRPFWYRWLDSKRVAPSSDPEAPPLVEVVEKIREDDFYSYHLALVAGGETRRWIIATDSMKPGDLIRTFGGIPRMPVKPVPGDAHPLGALPIGTTVCCVEVIPGQGASIARAAGTFATYLRKNGDMCVLQMPSKRELSVSERCMAVVGRVSNLEHENFQWGSANAKRFAGHKQHTGLWHRKTGRFGRKIRPPKPMISFDPNTGVTTIQKKKRSALVDDSDVFRSEI